MRPDGKTILFGLPGVRVCEVERVADGTRVVHVRTDDGTVAACPRCGVPSTLVRQRRTTRPRDLPYGEQPLVVRWHKVCSTPAARLGVHERRSPSRPAGARLTGRLRRHVAGLVGAAADGLMSWPVVHAAYVRLADPLLSEPGRDRARD